jgi:hypothetical protein
MSSIISFLKNEIKFSHDDLKIEIGKYLSEICIRKSLTQAELRLSVLRVIDEEIEEIGKKFPDENIAYSFGLSVVGSVVFFGKQAIDFEKCDKDYFPIVVIGTTYFTDLREFVSEFRTYLSGLVRNSFMNDFSKEEATDFYKEFGVSPYSFF